MQLRAEGGGKPLTFLVTAGERHEQGVFEPLVEQEQSSAGDRGGLDCARSEWPVTRATAVAGSATTWPAGAFGQSSRDASTNRDSETAIASATGIATSLSGLSTSSNTSVG